MTGDSDLRAELAVLIPAISQLAQVIAERGAGWLESLNEWSSTNLGFEVSETGSIGDLAKGAGDTISGFASGAFGTVLGIATSGIGLILNLATIAVFTFYLTADAPRVKNAVLRLFNATTQERIGWTDQRGRVLLHAGARRPAGFDSSCAVVVRQLRVGVHPRHRNVHRWAIPIALTLALGGLTSALIVLGYVLVYQQVENYWLSPKLSSKTMSLNGAWRSALRSPVAQSPGRWVPSLRSPSQR